MLISHDNGCARWTSIREAVAEDEPFCVVPRDDLLVLDADNVDQLLALESICDRLVSEGFRPVVLASGQPDHRHLFCTIRDHSYLQRLRDEAHSAGIDTRSHDGARIRPPFTRHRIGCPVDLLHPTSPEEALDALTTDHWDAYVEPRLTSQTWKLLRWGGVDDQQSETLFSVALGAAAVGYSGEKLYNLLRQERLAGGSSLRRRIREQGEDRARRWFFEYVWAKAEKKVATKPTFEHRDDAVQAILGVAEEIGMYKWQSVDLPATATGKPNRVGGASLRKVITTVVELCITKGTTTPYLGQRHLGELAGMERTTVLTALRGLELLGWLHLVKRGGAMKANTYRLLIGGERRNAPIDTPTISGVYVCGGEKRVPVGHDLFQRGSGVGDAGRRLLAIMSSSQGGTVKQLAAAAPVNEGYARRVLKRMKEVGLVRQQGRLWYAVDVDLDEVAQRVGTAGRAAARNARNDKMRAVQRAHIEKWKRARRLNALATSITAQTTPRVDQETGEIYETPQVHPDPRLHAPSRMVVEEVTHDMVKAEIARINAMAERLEHELDETPPGKG